MNVRDTHAAAPLRVLMVEDDPNDVELIRAYLGDALRSGIEVRHVRTLSEGMAAARSGEAQVVLLDLDLPDSSGLATLERMRAAAECPLVVISGNGHPALVDEALSRHAYDVIPKHRLDAPTLHRVLRLAAQHETSVRAGRARLTATFETSPVGLAHLDLDGRILIANQRLCDMLGYPREELVARTVRELSHPEDIDVTAEQIAQLRAGELPQFTARKRYLRKDGAVVWVQVWVSLEYDAAGMPSYEIAAFEDVTEMVLAQQRGERLARMYAALSETNEATLKAAEATTLYRRVCELLVEHAGLKLVAVRLVDPATQWIETVAHSGEPLSYLAGARVSVAPDRPGLQGPTSRTVMESRTVVSNDYLGEPVLGPWHEAARAAGIAAMAGVPLRRGGRTIGLLALYASERGWFDPELVSLAERMADNISFALDNLDREAARRDSEARFRALTEMSSDFYWETDEAHRFRLRGVGTRPASKPTFEEDSWLGKARWELPYLSPDEAGWRAHRETLAAHRPFRDFVFSRPCPEVGERFIMVSGDPVLDDSGRLCGYRGIGTDITEQRIAKLVLELEHAVASHLAIAESESEGVLGVMRAACAQLRLEHGRFWRVDERAGVLRIAAYWNASSADANIPAPMHELTFAPGEGLAGIVWDSGEPLWVADAAADPRTSQRAQASAPLRSAFLFPVRAEGRTLGVFTFGSERNRPPNERVLRAGAMIGGQIGLFLQRKRAEAALRESEARFRSLTELSADWYWEQDAELRFITTRGEGSVRGGITDAQHAGLRRWELSGTEPLDGDWTAHRAQLAARQPFRDFMLRRTGNDGKVHYVSVSGEPMFGDDGTFRGYRGVAKDVTASFEALGALRRFRAALDISADAVYLVDVDAMRIVDLNEAGWRNLGYAREELLGQPPSILFSDRGVEELRAQYAEMLEREQEAQPFRTHHRRKDGTLVPVEVTRRALRTPAGLYVVGIARDLSERLRGEERLRLSYERFEIVSRATNDVVWDWNLLTDEIWWNENFQALFGYAPVEVGTHIDSWTSRIHLEDLARVKAEVEAAITGRAKSWAGEYRFRRKDGAYADVYDRGLLIHDAQGRPVRMIGAMMDISERKRAESRMLMHAQRQEAVAAFGQFALGRRSPDELYAAAARALRSAGVDAALALEMTGEGGEYVVRASQGEGPHALVGQRGRVAPDSVWPDILRENTSRIAGRPYLSTRPTDRPWGEWVRSMGSAIYSPVREGERPVGMLCVYSAEEHAFGPDDARFVDSIGHVLSTALQRHKAEQRLAHLAQFDALTGLPNRSLLQDRLDQTIVQSRRKRWHAGVLFVDLDRFKLVNDTLGHHYGDALIREVGQRLLASVRPGDTVGRISGDEFAVVLADLARPDDAALVAQKILDTLAQPFDLGGNEAYVTASIGISAYPEDGADAEALLKNADMAMYRAKESARNSYCFFTAEMNQRTVAKVQLNADLRRAIERGEFALHYQPKVALATGALVGMEALLRWNHPTRGMVSPVEFVPALEDSGLILPVGEWVVAEACAQIRRWELAGLAPVPVAVNLSAKQFLRHDLDRTITHALAAAGVPPRLIELEITESCLMHNPEEAIRALHALRGAGLHISVDDFGTGYSSLAYLARFPLSALKIDRAFVRNVSSDATAAAIVRAVIDMANNLGLQVVAEGVETEQQAQFLRGHGCHQGQGFLFSRPVPASEVSARLRAAR